MAIKGKGRTRGRRSIAPPPRPQIVVRKPPIWRRAVTWIVVGVLILGAIGYGVWHWWDNHQAARLKAQEISAVEKYNSLVSVHYPPDQNNEGGTSLQIFSSVPAELVRLDQGKVSGTTAATEAKTFADTASNAADAIEKIQVTDVIPSNLSVSETTGLRTPGITQLMLSESQRYMVNAFRTYAAAGHLMQIAAGLPKGPQRSAVIAQAQSLMTTAGTLFDRGFRILANIRTVLGTLIPQPLQVPTAPPPQSPSP
ncbi:MAG TPA: hypothetical protein VGH10_04990 [Actinomycetota bacterium]|jgi:hypothetical protein